MTGIVHHETQRIAWHHVRHTYIVDVGTVIEAPLMDVSKLYENCIIDPPYPKTRFFEIEIDEQMFDGSRVALFQNIFPVQVEHEPEKRLLFFRIKAGTWSITRRIHFPTDTGEAQWIYTDDFNILFLSSGGRHDLEMLTSLITGKLLSIARSCASGTRIPSEFENQLSCRSAMGNLFAEGVDQAFRDAAIYQDFGLIEADKPRKNAATPSEKEIYSHHGRARVSADKIAALHVDIGEIEELQDLGWLGSPPE